MVQKHVKRTANQINHEVSEKFDDFTRRVRELRTAHGLTQAEVAERCGRTQAQISEIENGVSKMQIEQLMTYCEMFGVTPNELLGYDMTDLTVRILLDIIMAQPEPVIKKITERLNQR